jgi:hypothetical protein
LVQRIRGGASDCPLVNHLDSFWNPAQGTLVARPKELVVAARLRAAQV